MDASDFEVLRNALTRSGVAFFQWGHLPGVAGLTVEATRYGPQPTRERIDVVFDEGGRLKQFVVHERVF